MSGYLYSIFNDNVKSLNETNNFCMIFIFDGVTFWCISN